MELFSRLYALEIFCVKYDEENSVNNKNNNNISVVIIINNKTNNFTGLLLDQISQHCSVDGDMNNNNNNNTDAQRQEAINQVKHLLVSFCMGDCCRERCCSG